MTALSTGMSTNNALALRLCYHTIDKEEEEKKGGVGQVN
jgi:hypothetical protein